MSVAIALAMTLLRDQSSDLLDQVVAQPADVIRTQISTKGRYLADAYEFVDEFKTDTLGRRKSNLSPLDLLIARGAEAVPYLVSQLSDSTPTKLVLKGDASTKFVPYEAYDPLVRQPETDYWNVVTQQDVEKAGDSVHIVTRGDLAFFALGQIVNRWYGILFPGKLTLYCSASDHPAMVKQATADWGKLTIPELRSLLRTDIKKPDSYARMTYGFQRFRSYFPGEASDLAVEALHNTFGRWPKGEPAVEPDSFIIELQPVASWQIDQACYQILSKTDKENGFLSEYGTTKYEVLLYLKDRPNYLSICQKYANEFVKKKQDTYGYYAQFLRRYGRK